MSGHSIAFWTLFLSLIAQSGFGQLPPDSQADRPKDPAAAKLVDDIIAQRSQLKLTGDVASLKSNLAVIDRLVSQAKQARELEIQKSGPESGTTKRLNLLVEGFERLSDRVARIPRLIEKKEHQLAAETMKFVAAMDRAWSGKYNPDSQPLVQAAKEQAKLGADLIRPFKPLQKQIQTGIGAKKWDDVSKLYSQLIQDQRSQLGPHHSEVIDTLLTASGFEYAERNMERSIELGKSALEVLEQLHGKTHPEVRRLEARLQSLERLQKVSPEVQRLVKGVENAFGQLPIRLTLRTPKQRSDLLASAVASSRDIQQHVGPDSQMYAKAVSTIAQLCSKYQNPSEAKFRFEIADEAMRAVQLDQTPEYANLLRDWSVVCKTLGDDELAFKLIQNAIGINRKLHGEENLEYITDMENYGAYFFHGEGYDKALFVFEKVAKLRFAVSGPADVRYHHTRERLAATLFKLKRLKEAESVLTELNAIRKPEPGFETVLDVDLAQLTGSVAQRQGRQAEAIRAYERSVELAERVHGKTDVHYSIAMANLAGTLMRGGNDPRIGTLLTDALKIDREYVDRISFAQTERQHFRKIEEFRYSLFLYLTYAIGAGNLDREMYEQILAWKGRSFRERWASNTARHASETPQLGDAYTQLCRILSNFATSIEQRGEKALNEAEFMKVVEDKEAVWRASARTKAKTDDVVKATLADIQQALPKNVALVDYSYYRHFSFPDAEIPQAEDRILAAIVRADQPVKLISVGQAKPTEKA
ncbi:MAG: hypothetical protein JWN70_4287, partial [Planctomycetaceae bacterium]|nr:hypothetical protein [Planctomycetaceae bacterium]